MFKNRPPISTFVPEPVKGTRLYRIARTNKPEVKRFVKFAIVGAMGLVVDYALLNVLAHGLHVYEPIAVGIAFVTAATHNYVWNRFWVYPESRTVKKRKQMPVFLTVNAIGLGINELVLFLCYAPISALISSSVIGLNLTKAISAVIVMIWNYAVNRLVTFRNVKWARATPQGSGM
ncbi:MAG: GtrA family protein [Anaerolineae bacterium]|nr:GtrA family protein [Thermoflexales bacterium]MDW8396006.1 GtrA family protein [Anaerolineae bacterium]